MQSTVVIKRRSPRVDYYRFVPAQLSLHQYQRHEDDIRPHPQRAEAKYDGGFGHTAGVTLEHLGGVGRDIPGSADAESQISADHRYRWTCTRESSRLAVALERTRSSSVISYFRAAGDPKIPNSFEHPIIRPYYT